MPESPTSSDTGNGSRPPAAPPDVTGLRVLVIDDEESVRRVISLVFEKHEAIPVAAADAEEAESLLGGEPFDVVLLDVEMPGESGWNLLERMRAAGDETPVIFVTGRHAVEERVRGLRLGADDYVLKPFENAELVARVEAVVRRRRAMPVLRSGDLRVDLGRRTVERHGQRIEVSPREFDLLLFFAESAGRAWTRSQILNRVWGGNYDGDTRTVDSHVRRLRPAIEDDPSDPQWIQTVWGVGYRMREP